MIGNEAMEIADISITPEQRAEDLRAREAPLKRPFVYRDKEWKVLSSYMDLLQGEVQLILELLRQWTKLAVGCCDGKRKAFARLPLASPGHV